MEISSYRKAPKQTNRKVERKNKTRAGKKKKKERKEREERKRKENARRRGGGKIFILPVGGKREILELIFNAINCLMKHNNLSC